MAHVILNSFEVYQRGEDVLIAQLGAVDTPEAARSRHRIGICCANKARVLEPQGVDRVGRALWAEPAAE